MTGLKLAPLTLALLGLVAAVGAAPLDPARTFLKTVFDLSPAEISGVDTGEVISRTLEVTNRREVATLGVVKIKGTPSMYVERLTDIAAFKRTDDVLQIGTFSSTPQLGDVASLTIEEADLKRLRSCRADDCNVRLSAEGIERFRRDVDWHTADASRVGGQLVRQLLVDYVARYRQSGAASAMEYADRAPRMNVGREFALLVDADTVTWKSVPRLRRHLLEYPAPSAGTTDFIYWSKELVRSRPVVSITHVAIVPAVDDSPVAYAIGSKQIYAMHYYDASLGLTLLVPDPTAASPATYVVYLNRSRIDMFEGMFGGVARRIVAGRARSIVAEQMARVQGLFARNAG